MTFEVLYRKRINTTGNVNQNKFFSLLGRDHVSLKESSVLRLHMHAQNMNINNIFHEDEIHIYRVSGTTAFTLVCR